MKARGVVFEKPFGSTGERLPHPLRVRLIDGPNADPESPGFCLVGDAPIGATVTVEYSPQDPFAYLVEPSELCRWLALSGALLRPTPEPRAPAGSMTSRTGVQTTSKGAARAARRSPSSS